MIFPSEKRKELLRYATRNNPATCDADGTPTPMQQPQRHLPPPPRPPHTPQTPANCCCCCSSDPTTTTTTTTTTILMTNSPPPPYRLIPCSKDYSGSFRGNRQDQQQLIYRTDVEPEPELPLDADMSVTEATESDISYMKNGCSYGSSFVDLLSDENGVGLGVGRGLGVETVPAYYNTQRIHPATNFAMQAANMFRNCCGGGGGGHTTDSSSGSNPRSRTRTNPPDSRQRNSTSHPSSPCPIHAPLPITGGAVRQRTLSQHLNALLKPFKNKQIAELLLAVKSRKDPAASNSNNNNNNSYLQCILIKCTSPLDQEQHVTTCQLFFWSDLRDAGELKRLPSCPSARDYVYTCCNPLHWYRILHPIDSESAPPPYQRSKMLRLRDTDSEGNTQNNIERSTGGRDNNNSSHHHHHHHNNNNNNSNSNNQSQSISSIISKQAESQLYVPSLESFTTDGKDRSACSKVWCQIAYWELAQRVGELFHAKKPAVNIYADGPLDNTGESMCLRDLGGKRPSTDAVQNTRQKIGLGVSLSLEGGDVWIFNCSNVPIFVDSPTLSERLDRVCKVMPGYCLKAFETNRAQWLAIGNTQSQHNQLGPIDRFSMKISFAKGWGNSYRRQDVMGCNCWLEVHFTHLR